MLALALLPAVPALATETAMLPAPLQAIVETAQSSCAAFEDGRFALDWGAVDRTDLDGDLQPDWVLNERGFSCSSAASLFCGTGGCLSHFLVGDVVTATLNRGWRVTTLGTDTVLLTDVHGSQCDGINPTPCVAASVWDGEASAWRSTTAIWE